MDAILDSRLGKILVIGYTVVTLLTYVFSFACGTESCSLYIVAPILPWAYILANDFGLAFPWAVYPILILLNASIAYTVGAGLERVYGFWKERQEENENMVSPSSVEV